MSNGFNRATVLAGGELVEIPCIAELTESQLAYDHQALRTSAVTGLVLSWHLWHMPLARLHAVARLWGM